MLQYGPRLMLLASLGSAKPRLQQNVPPNLSIDDMPTYDYECDACGHQFEVFQGINDEVLTKCPECNKKKLKRLFGSGLPLCSKAAGSIRRTIGVKAIKKPRLLTANPNRAKNRNHPQRKNLLVEKTRSEVVIRKRLAIDRLDASYRLTSTTGISP